MKTLDDCKNEVVVKRGFENWIEFQQAKSHNLSEIYVRLDEAAELYARAKWDECYVLTCSSATVNRDTYSVLFTKPEFKP